MAAHAAAEAFLVQKSSLTTFSDFFVEEGLDEPDSYLKFYSPEEAARSAGLIPEGEPPDDVLEYLGVPAKFQDLLHSANANTEWLYRAVALFLGETTDHVEPVTAALPILQASKRLGRHIGSITSESMLSCFFSTTTSKMFKTIPGQSNNDQELVFNPETYRSHIAPNRGREIGCPLLSRILVAPQDGKKILLYDLYWEAAVAQAFTSIALDAQGSDQ